VLAALVVAGGLLPWAHVSAGATSLTRSGLAGDGMITVAVAVALAIAVAANSGRLLDGFYMALAAMAGGALIAAVALYDWSAGYWRVESEPGILEAPGAGVALTLVAGLALVILAVIGDWYHDRPAAKQVER
jgi:hypothetical protein